MKTYTFETSNFFKMDSEKITGVIFGSMSGVITTYNGIDLFITLGIALITGFLGAFGAHMFKVISHSLQERRKKKGE